MIEINGKKIVVDGIRMVELTRLKTLVKSKLPRRYTEGDSPYVFKGVYEGREALYLGQSSEDLHGAYYIGDIITVEEFYCLKDYVLEAGDRLHLMLNPDEFKGTLKIRT